jgi:S1-C subfamily serine protease
MLTLLQWHKKCMYPEVRVQATKAIGSGTIVYSAPVPEKPDQYETYVLTNEHVVDDLITIKDDHWSSLHGRYIQKDVRGTAVVETFLYGIASRVIGSTSYLADIVCYDKNEDLALLQIRAANQFPDVARLYPEDQVNDLLAGMEVRTVGAGLGEKPFMSPPGFIGQFGFEIENKEFLLVSSASIFGNSGGATFMWETGEFLGIPARIPVRWGGDAITHMSFIIPVWRVYEFLREQVYQFVFDSSVTSKDCEEERERKREEDELKTLRAGLRREGPKKSSVNPALGA